MASLHFPEYFHEKLDDIMHLKSSDSSIRWPFKNQLITASLAIDEYYKFTHEMYKKPNASINNYNDELKRLYRDFVRKNLFEVNGRGIPEDWKVKI